MAAVAAVLLQRRLSKPSGRGVTGPGMSELMAASKFQV
jgi:hypothetical protein